jgi:hypothetical protein
MRQTQTSGSAAKDIRCDSTFILVKLESHLNTDLNVYRSAIFHGRLELPLLDRLNGFGVETHAEAADYANVARTALIIDDEPEDASPLSFGDPSLLGVFRIGSRNWLRGGNPAAYFENAAANPATAASADARTMTYTHAAARTGPDAGT